MMSSAISTSTKETNMPAKPNLPAQLKRWRKRIAKILRVESIYLREAADLIQVPYKTWQNWELGRRKPSSLAIAQLNHQLEEVERLLTSKELNKHLLSIVKQIQLEHGAEVQAA